LLDVRLSVFGVRCAMCGMRCAVCSNSWNLTLILVHYISPVTGRPEIRDILLKSDYEELAKFPSSRTYLLTFVKCINHAKETR